MLSSFLFQTHQCYEFKDNMKEGHCDVLLSTVYFTLPGAAKALLLTCIIKIKPPALYHIFLQAPAFHHRYIVPLSSDRPRCDA